MRLIADTHALIWFLAGSERLSPAARHAMADAGNQVLASAASFYEVSLKARLGRLDARIAAAFLPRLRAARFGLLPLTADHALAAGTLPGPHRDPWDRILMAQSRLEDAPLLTCDPVFTEYGLQVVW